MAVGDRHSAPPSGGAAHTGRAGVIDIVVPAQNHAATLRPLLADLPHRAIRSVVVVDRASTDQSAHVARDAGAQVLYETGGGYGAACQRALAHLSSLPRVPDVVVFIPGDRPGAAPAIADLVAPIDSRGVELVLGVEPGKRSRGEAVVGRIIETVYRHRWAGLGPVRAAKFPALVALGMRDRGDGWDVEMLVRAVKLGLSCSEVALPDSKAGKLGGRALLHILRHSTMR